jgi:hypothetical protein
MLFAGLLSGPAAEPLTACRSAGLRRARIGEIASAVNLSTVDEDLPIPDNVSR